MSEFSVRGSIRQLSSWFFYIFNANENKTFIPSSKPDRKDKNLFHMSLRWSEFRLELSLAVVVFEVDTSSVESDEDHSGKHAQPVLGKWMLEALQSPTGQRNCSSPVMANDEWFICQPCGNGNLKGRGFLYSKLKGTFATASEKEKHRAPLWPCRPLHFGLKAARFMRAIHLASPREGSSWSLSLLPCCPFPPELSLFFWVQNRGVWRHKKCSKITASVYSPYSILLVKRKLILCFCSTKDGVKNSTVAIAE